MRLSVPSFDQVPCTGAERIRFLLGEGTLSDAQKAFFSGSVGHLGAAVRTDYDSASLRGRGFVFVASDRRSNGIQVPAWNHEPTLKGLMVHEIGHILGIPHVSRPISSVIGSGSFAQSVMAQDYPQALSSLSQVRRLELGTFFAPPSILGFCRLDDGLRKDLGLKGQECLRFDISPLLQSSSGEVTIWRHPKDGPSKIDRYASAQASIDESRIQWQPVINVHLTSRQTVFPSFQPIIAASPSRALDVPAAGKLGLTLNLTFKRPGSGEPKTLTLKISSAESVLMAPCEGKIQTVEADTLLEALGIAFPVSEGP